MVFRGMKLEMEQFKEELETVNPKGVEMKVLRNRIIEMKVLKTEVISKLEDGTEENVYSKTDQMTANIEKEARERGCREGQCAAFGIPEGAKREQCGHQGMGTTVTE